MVICSSQETNCINCVEKESCYLCRKTLDKWIKTSIHLDGSEKPIILCCSCAKAITKDVNKNSSEPETRELVQDVKECRNDLVPLKVLALLLFGLFLDLWIYG